MAGRSMITCPSSSDGRGERCLRPIGRHLAATTQNNHAPLILTSSFTNKMTIKWLHYICTTNEHLFRCSTEQRIAQDRVSGFFRYPVHKMTKAHQIAFWGHYASFRHSAIPQDNYSGKGIRGTRIRGSRIGDSGIRIQDSGIKLMSIAIVIPRHSSEE